MFIEKLPNVFDWVKQRIRNKTPEEEYYKEQTEEVSIWEQAASTFMALLMVFFGIIMLGEILVLRFPGVQSSNAPIYVIAAAIIFNGSNFLREKVIPKKANTVISISVNFIIVTVLVYFTGGLNSDFYVVFFLIPAITALCFGLKGTILSLSAIFLSFLWFLYTNNSVNLVTGTEIVFIKTLSIILVSVPFLVFVERDKRHEKRLSISIRRLEKTLEDLRRTQSQLVQSSKLAVLGKLSASIVHDLNQPLANMSLYAEIALKKVGKSSSVKQDIEVIREQTDRIKKITEGLRSLYHRSDFKLVPINITKSIDDVVQLISPQLRISGIRVIRDYCCDLPKIYGDESQLQQVFLNLLTNAADSFDSLERNEKQIVVCSAIVGGTDFIEVTVSDNGCGIPADIINDITKPFFTTKKSGKGAGLGLSITSDIIYRHSGFFRIFSSAKVETQPTTAKMLFPSLNAKACWEAKKCDEKFGDKKEMCLAYSEKQGFRCWEVLGKGKFEQDESWLDECYECDVFKNIMAMLEKERMIEIQKGIEVQNGGDGENYRFDHR